MRRLRNVLVYGLATLGVLFALLLSVGVLADYRNFDRTEGGYEPPYTDYTGEPIDWSQAYATPTGMFTNGRVLDTHVNCTTGMISFEVFGQRFDWRELSPRALAVHDPRSACEELGFEPEF
jgi:hypothetical protein